jgi:Mg-chelatase subunit ChlD
MSVPESFLCPISHQVMGDPYIDTDGNSYEKSAIMEWLATRQISPITRHPLLPSSLVPNRVLKTLIEEFNNTGAVVAVPEEPLAPLDRKPIMLFAVIDNSGSMGESCGNNPTGEDDGFSRLDLVKHTMNTIITALSPQDKICLIKFSNAAEVIADLTTLTETSKKALMETMKNLAPEYSTNIWDGLRAALDIVASLPTEAINNYNIQVFLLTDGVPNINPPRPITETLETYLSKKCAGRRPKVSTFGYGYSLLSDVLYDLAKVADGCFGFIPDSSMVGTVFINSLSSSLVEADHTLQNDVIDRVTQQFCALLRKLLVETVYATQRDMLTQFTSEVEAQLEAARADAGDARTIDFLESLLLDCKDSTDPNVGQIAKAVQAAFFLKWGKHYLYSVLSAFEHKVCINFKDKAMQIFKSEKFKVEQERIEEVFLTLPAPKPHASNHQQYNGYYNPAHHTAQAYAASAAPVSMGNYHMAGGGCFTGDSLVLRVGVEQQLAPVRVRDLQPGDAVWSEQGATEVECLVQLRYNGPVYRGN